MVRILLKKHNIPIFVFFVDEMLGEIYGNFLSKLEKEIQDDTKYPFTMPSGQIIFSMKNMIRNISMLDSVQINNLKNHSERAYGYI